MPHVRVLVRPKKGPSSSPQTRQARSSKSANHFTLGAVLDELERTLPKLRGTFREQTTGKRRAFVRDFVCQEDFSHEALETLSHNP